MPPITSDIHINVAASPNATLSHNNNSNNSVDTATQAVRSTVPFNIDSSASDTTTLLNGSTSTKHSATTTDSLIQRRIVQPFLTILKSGATTHGLSMSIACGVTAGLFPVPATTSVIVLIFVYIFQLNIAMCQLINLLMTPLNIGTFLTFIQAGNYVFGVSDAAKISLEFIQNDPITAVQLFGSSLARGCVVWLMVAPFLTAIVYFVVKPVIGALMANTSKSKLNP